MSELYWLVNATVVLNSYGSDAVVYGSNGVRDDGVGGSCDDVSDAGIHDFSDADEACESEGDNHQNPHHIFLFSA